MRDRLNTKQDWYRFHRFAGPTCFPLTSSPTTPALARPTPCSLAFDSRHRVCAPAVPAPWDTFHQASAQFAPSCLYSSAHPLPFQLGHLWPVLPKVALPCHSVSPCLTWFFLISRITSWKTTYICGYCYLYLLLSMHILWETWGVEFAAVHPILRKAAGT